MRAVLKVLQFYVLSYKNKLKSLPRNIILIHIFTFAMENSCSRDIKLSNGIREFFVLLMNNLLSLLLRRTQYHIIVIIDGQDRTLASVVNMAKFTQVKDNGRSNFIGYKSKSSEHKRSVKQFGRTFQRRRKKNSIW